MAKWFYGKKQYGLTFYDPWSVFSLQNRYGLSMERVEPESLFWAPVKRSFIIIARGHRRGGIVPVPSADW
jgi:hypothetical protein